MFARRSVTLLSTLALLAALLAFAPPAGAQATPRCDGKVATVVGTNGDDVLRGTSGRDVIVGLGGDDRIFGLGGSDTLCGGAGRDRLEGGPGRDVLIGAGGGDRLYGGPGDDSIVAERGNDRLYGGRGDDALDGGIGVDRLYGQTNNDSCVTDFLDVLQRDCETGNYKSFSGRGDDLFRPRLDDDTFPVIERCFDFTRNCDQYYAARIRLDGSTNFDALGVEAFNLNGDTIATYGNAGDRYRGVFLFNERPTRLQIDSGGGDWEVLFLQASGLRVADPRTTGVGNQVYFIKRPVRGTSVQASANWNGFGKFGVVGVSPLEGRDLLFNEVRFGGQDNPPFSAQTVADSRVTLVQVLSDEGSWTVNFSR